MEPTTPEKKPNGTEASEAQKATESTEGGSTESLGESPGVPASTAPVPDPPAPEPVAPEPAETPAPVLLPPSLTIIAFRVHKQPVDPKNPEAGESIVDRPFLIFGPGSEPGTLNGLLFFQGEDDRACHWASRNTFFLPGQQNTLILRNKKQGYEEGEWHED